MQGPRETAIAITQLVIVGPKPLPLQFRGMSAANAGEMIALLASELADAGVTVERIELPAEWYEQATLRINDGEFRACLKPLQESDFQIYIYRVD